MSRYAYLVTTWSGPKLVETIHSIPKDSRLVVVDGSQHGWSLARQWNAGLDRLFQEGFEAVIVCNDDIVFRPDTPDRMVDMLLTSQYDASRPDRWTHKDLLLISARHAAPSDAFTEKVDWALMELAEPRLQPGPDFSCFVTSPRLFTEVGRFDEDFLPCYFEDNDMHRRIVLAGFEAGAYGVYWHFRSATYRHDIQRQQIVNTGGFENSKRHYVEKWGGVPSQERYVTPFNR